MLLITSLKMKRKQISKTKTANEPNLFSSCPCHSKGFIGPRIDMDYLIVLTKSSQETGDKPHTKRLRQPLILTTLRMSRRITITSQAQSQRIGQSAREYLHLQVGPSWPAAEEILPANAELQPAAWLSPHRIPEIRPCSPG